MIHTCARPRQTYAILEERDAIKKKKAAAGKSESESSLFDEDEEGSKGSKGSKGGEKPPPCAGGKGNGSSGDGGR